MSTTHHNHLTSALSWTLQRLTSDSPPRTRTSPAPSISEEPPSRLPSPFTPPPLTPLSITGYLPTTTSRILNRTLAEEIRILLPPRLQLHETWTLGYSLEQHGVSLATLYARCNRGPLVLVVKDSSGGIFGAFLNEPFKPSGRYIGTGECFLWKATPLPQVASDGGEDRIRFKAFPYSGINDYMILCDNSFLSVGGGDGRYGLWLDDRFEKGVSQSCLTFGNEPLSDEGEKFEVIGVEVWMVG